MRSNEPTLQHLIHKSIRKNQFHISLQELQRMWEPSRFTYDVNDVVPHSQAPSKRAKL